MIDAIDWLREEDYETYSVIGDNITFIISNQPIAYGVNKVVERLKELRELDACDFDNCPVEDTLCCDCVQRRIAERAIEIVKEG